MTDRYDTSTVLRHMQAANAELNRLVLDRDILASCFREVSVEVKHLRNALMTINAIRNSIVGTQTINWSAHVYPLVLALEDAGFNGEDYAVARDKAETLLQQRDEASSEATRLLGILKAVHPEHPHPEICEACEALGRHQKEDL